MTQRHTSRRLAAAGFAVAALAWSSVAAPVFAEGEPVSEPVAEEPAPEPVVTDNGGETGDVGGNTVAVAAPPVPGQGETTVAVGAPPIPGAEAPVVAVAAPPVPGQSSTIVAVAAPPVPGDQDEVVAVAAPVDAASGPTAAERLEAAAADAAAVFADALTLIEQTI